MAALLCGLLMVGTLLSACSGSPSSSGSSASGPSSSGGSSTGPSSAASGSTPTPAPAPPPKANGCHRLDFAAATQPTDDSAPVPCRRRHTTRTIAVGEVDPVRAGHLFAIDSDHVQAQLSTICPRRLASYVGGEETTRRLSMLRAVWFGPSVEQADLGARWYRCDVVALAGDDRLAPLSADLRGALDRDDALDRYGICGTAAPSARDFERVICSAPHRWRAVDIVEFPATTRYLGGPAGKAADTRCKDAASARAEGALEFRWSFQWPTSRQWQDGQRYGYCWVPTD